MLADLRELTEAQSGEAILIANRDVHSMRCSGCNMMIGIAGWRVRTYRQGLQDSVLASAQRFYVMLCYRIRKGGILQHNCYCQMCKGLNMVMCRESEDLELRGMSQLVDKLVIVDLLPMPNTEEEVACLTLCPYL